MKKLMILGAGEMQVPVIQKAREMSFQTIVVDYNDTSPGFEIADKKALISTLDYEKILILARNEKIDGILTTSDLPVNIVAKIGSALNLSSMSVLSAQLCTNKFIQRSCLKENEIRTPLFKLIENGNDLEDVDFFPAVIKPVDSSASRGVKMVNNMVELINQYQISKEYSRQGNVIVEEFIIGREFSIETFTQKNVTTIIAITEKIVSGAQLGYFVEDLHLIPARISSEEYRLISAEVLKGIKALGINNSPSHTEIKLNDEGIYIVEIACRLGGDYITSDLVPLSTGIDMLENLINLSIREKLKLSPKYTKVSCVQFLNANNYLKCADFIEKSGHEIIKYELKEFHDRTITSSFDRMGYIILQTETLEEMERLISQLNE